MAQIEHLRPEGMANNPAYSHAVKATGGSTVYISGQVAIDAAGSIVGVGDLEAQTEQVMVNLGIALAAAGGSFADIVKLTTYVVDYHPAMRPTITSVRSRHITGGDPPASTLVGVSALAAPEWLIEIEAVAVIG